MGGPKSTVEELKEQLAQAEREEKERKLQEGIAKKERRAKEQEKRDAVSKDKERVAMAKKKIENIDELTEFLSDPKVDGLKLFYWHHVAGKPRATIWIAKRPKVCSEVREALSYSMPMQVFGGVATKTEGCIHDLIYAMDGAKEYFEEIKDKLQEKYGIDLTDDEAIRALMCAHKKSGIGRINQEPKTLSWDKDVVCSQWFNPGEWLKDGDFPLWEEFMSRFTSPTAPAKFMAWVWSIFEENDPLRCACHIQGPAESGKSALARTLTAITKDFCMSVTGESFNNQFSAAKLYTKRVATWDDCREFFYITKELIHSALGGGMVDVERKGESSFVGKLHIKLLVMSNYPPKLEDEENMRSRMLYIKVKGRGKDRVNDPKYDQKLQEEFPYFLKACKQAYLSNVIDGKLAEETQHLAECFTVEQGIFNDLCETKMVFGKDFEIEQADLRILFNKHLEKHKMDTPQRRGFFKFGAFERYLQTHMGVEIIEKNRRVTYAGMADKTKVDTGTLKDDVIL
jgi:hypothetical protein